MKIKIFEDGTIKECLQQCLAEGYFPATVNEIGKLIKEKKIPNQWYDTSTICFDYKIKEATKKELDNIEEFYGKGGRVLFVNYSDDGFLSVNYLRDDGRFVGVRK